MKNDHLFKSAKTNSIKNKKCKYLDALETLKKKLKNQKRENLRNTLKQNLMIHLKTERQKL